ncbi:TPA: hypothetical protein HA318_04140, partial [Candidatus Micrarchaeota archaeon]|nr:hypothetical protein [Candidatus Micrarchaeota archaeon]
MNSIKTAFLVVALLCVASFAAAEVSSETALSTAQPYLKKGEAASITGKYSVKDNA